jgi:hypothetical protein
MKNLMVGNYSIMLSGCGNIIRDQIGAKQRQAMGEEDTLRLEQSNFFTPNVLTC